MGLNSFVTPTNLIEEREKFFSSRTYNPIFEYNWDTGEIQQWLNSGSQGKYKNFVDAVISQNTDEIVREAEKVFGTRIEEETLNLAEKIISEEPEVEEQGTVDDLVRKFEEVFVYFDLVDYKVDVVDEHGFNARPSVEKKNIVLSRYASLQFFSVDGQVRHEILHILRGENGKYNNIEKTEKYLPTEEGLACYVQDFVGEDGKGALFQHAAEYAVTSVGLKGSLREMVEYLQDIGFDKELAWQRAVRHKFGYVDTSKAGDIMKPSMYFFNENKIKNLTDDERLRLMVGKIGIEDLGEYPTYRGKFSEDKMRNFVM